MVRGFELSKDLYTLGIKERPTASQDEVIEKYQSLKNIKNFLLTLDNQVLMSQQSQQNTGGNRRTRKRKNARANANYVIEGPVDQAERLRNIKQQYIKNIAINSDRN